MTHHDDLPYLNHIMDAITDIEESTSTITKREFIITKDCRDATILRIQIIGEAVKRISPQLKEKNHEIEWKKIAETRNRMIHGYFNVDLDVVWSIIKIDLPNLKHQINNIKRKLE